MGWTSRGPGWTSSMSSRTGGLVGIQRGYRLCAAFLSSGWLDCWPCGAGKLSFTWRAEERGHGGSELGWPDGVHQMPGGDRHQLAVRDERGHARELALVDMAGRGARDEKCRGLNPPQLIAPVADLRVGELVAHRRHVPVERQRAFGTGEDPWCSRPWRRGFLQHQAGYAAGAPCRVQVGERAAYRMPAERHLLKFQCVEKCRQVGGELLDRVRGRPVAGAVPAQVGCVHPSRRPSKM